MPAEPSIDLPCKQDLDIVLDKSLVRAPYIRHMADDGMKKVCRGNFAVMHWRNKTGECTTRNAVCNDFSQSLEILLSAATAIVNDITKLLSVHNLTCLYMAKPMYQQEMETLIKKTKLDVYSLSDLLEISPEIKKYEEDNYILSLVEQEIAERAKLFISSRSSNWSYYVEYTRNLRKKKTVGLQEFPSVPKELLALHTVI
ncbi:uncharacterized protein LOC144441409 [Glandiceps talaboti]